MDKITQTNPRTSFAFLRTCWPALLGLLVLYIPTYFDLSRTIWQHEENIHGPMVLFAVAWLFWRQREALLIVTPPSQTPKILGGVFFVFGLFLYAVGRSQEILIFEVGSQIPVLIGVLYIALGGQAVRMLWFPLFFLIFMVPLPSVIIDAMTSPLKEQISSLTESILYAFGYPIARSGVILNIGPYQLLVADACSGLHSMFSLSAMGILYLYLLHDTSKLRNALMIASILPIAFTANIVRVIVLVLVTYHFGDEAGQGFLHKFAGMILFVAALSMLFTLDWLLELAIKDNAQHGHKSQYNRLSEAATATKPQLLDTEPVAGAAVPGLLVMGLGLAMLGTVYLAVAMKPAQKAADQTAKFDLETLIPKQFAGWRVDETAVPLIKDPKQEASIRRIYSQTLTRTYVNEKGQRVMLSIAYGSDQSDLMAVHHPEVCYPAQGFPIAREETGVLTTAFGTIPVTKLIASRPTMTEPITYWIMTADKIQTSNFRRKLDKLKFTLTGMLPDGLLFRVSTISPPSDESRGYEAQESFIRTLLGSLTKENREHLIGKDK